MSEVDSCQRCPDDDQVSPKGSPDSLSCVLGVYRCSSITEPIMEARAPPYAKRRSDCVKMECDAPLGDVSFEGCLGCPAGKYGEVLNCPSCTNGTFLNCFSCTNGTFCPGFTRFPVALPDDASVPKGCPWRRLEAGTVPAPNEFFSDPLAEIYYSFVGTRTVLGFVILVSLCIFFSLPLYLLCPCPLSESVHNNRCARWYKGLTILVGKRFIKFDAMGMSFEVDDLKYPQQRRGLLGGLLTFLVKIGIGFLALNVLLNFISLKNAMRTTSLIARDSAAFSRFTALPWLSSRPAGLPSLRGLQVRVLASGGAGPRGAAGTDRPCSRSLLYDGAAMTFSNLASGHWNESQGPDCGNDFDLLIFTCWECEVEAQEAFLSVPLHHSCQALSVEIIAVGPAPDASSMSLMEPAGSVTRYEAPLNGKLDTQRLQAVAIEVK